jgi:hypothetical protein
MSLKVGKFHYKKMVRDLHRRKLLEQIDINTVRAAKGESSAFNVTTGTTRVSK